MAKGQRQKKSKVGEKWKNMGRLLNNWKILKLDGKSKVDKKSKATEKSKVDKKSNTKEKLKMSKQ